MSLRCEYVRKVFQVSYFLFYFYFLDFCRNSLKIINSDNHIILFVMCSKQLLIPLFDKTDQTDYGYMTVNVDTILMIFF